MSMRQTIEEEVREGDLVVVLGTEEYGDMVFVGVFSSLDEAKRRINEHTQADPHCYLFGSEFLRAYEYRINTVRSGLRVGRHLSTATRGGRGSTHWRDEPCP